jgi:hypothetical protein
MLHQTAPTFVKGLNQGILFSWIEMWEEREMEKCPCQMHLLSQVVGPGRREITGRDGKREINFRTGNTSDLYLSNEQFQLQK